MAQSPHRHRGTAQTEDIGADDLAGMPRGRPLVASLVLTDQERRTLGRRHPALAGFSSAIVVLSSAAVDDDVAHAVGRLVEAVNERRSTDVEELVSELVARTDSLLPQFVDEASRLARTRARLLRDFGGYTSAEVADRRSSRATNRHKLAHDWRARGRIFSVRFDRTEYFLPFQFDERGQPLPVIADILRELRHWGDWDKAIWFVSSNGQLNHAIPAELLTTAPDEVVQAARMDAHIRVQRVR
jgi:hypothetical protein